MNINIILVLFASFAIFAVTSCSKNGDQSKDADVLYPEITLDRMQKEPVRLSEIFPEHRLIELETNEDCLIGDKGTKIIKRDSLFYISSTNKIFVFNNNGKYLRKLSACGAGPEEYIKLSDFDIVDDYNELWICSDEDMTVKRYDLNSFDFKGKLSFNFGVFSIKYLGNNLFIMDTSEEEGIHKIIDSSGQIIESIYKNDMANGGTYLVDYFYSPSNKKIIHQLRRSNDVIYYDLDSKQLGLSKLLDCDAALLTAADNLKAMNENGYLGQMTYVAKNFIQILQVAEVDDMLVMILRYPDNEWKILISRGGDSVVIPYFPADQSMVQNDIIENAVPMMLNTLVCGDSGDSFLFLGMVEDSEVNPSILEVTKVAIP